MTRVKEPVFFIITIAIFTFACSTSYEKQYQIFLEWEGSEENIMDPLIVSGDGIVPTVLKKLKDKNQPRRGVAIRFLWNGNYVESVPVLETILKDKNDSERIAALYTIYGLDSKKGMKYAKEFQYENSRLGKVARDLIKDKEGWLANKRSYKEAFFSYYTNWLH